MDKNFINALNNLSFAIGALIERMDSPKEEPKQKTDQEKYFESIQQNMEKLVLNSEAIIHNQSNMLNLLSKPSPTIASSPSSGNSLLNAGISSMAEGITMLVKDNIDIMKNQQTMISLLSKPSPGIGSIFDKKQKVNIKDGVTTILGIATGILAIGSAFKLVGGIDFASVVGLSISLPLVVHSFEKIAQSKFLNRRTIVDVGIVAVGIAGAIAASSLILKFTQELSPGQLLTGVGISAMFAIVSSSLGKLVSNIKKISLVDMLKLPSVMIGVSTAILASSWILNKVQPLSVGQIITSIAISAMFAIVSVSIGKVMTNLNKVNIKDLWKFPLVMGSIAASIAASSWILQAVVPVGLAQMTTAILISGMFAVVSLSAGKLIKSVKDADPSVFYKLPMIMVGVATAILGSSYLFSKIPNVTFGQMLTAILVGVSFIPIALALPFIAIAMKKLDAGRLIGLPFFMTAVAGAMYGVSLIYQNMPIIEVGKLFNIVLQSAAFAISSVVMGTAMWAIGKMGLDVIGKGALGIGIIAATIAVSSHILALGNYEKYPSLSWAAGVGLSTLAFGVNALALGLLMDTGIGAEALLLGGAGMLGLSYIIQESSHILALGNYDKYPSLSWASGVGLTMLAFGMGAAAIGAIMITGIGAGALWLGAKGMGKLSQIIVDVAATLAKGNYGKYPSLSWASGVGLTMRVFGEQVALMGALSLLIVPGSMVMVTLAQTIVDVATKLGSGNYTGGPTKEWSSGISSALAAFAPLYKMISDNGILNIFTGSNQTQFAQAISAVADGLVSAETAFNTSGGFDITKVPSLEWSKNIGGAITAFIPALAILHENSGIFSDGSDSLKNGITAISEGIQIASQNIGKGKYSTIPNNWMSNIAMNIRSYIDMAKYVAASDIRGFNIAQISNGMDAVASGYSRLGEGIRVINAELDGLDIDKLNALRNMTGSIVLMSLMDKDQFNGMMDALENKAKIFVDVMNGIEDSTTKNNTLSFLNTSKIGNTDKTNTDIYNITAELNNNITRLIKPMENVSNYVNEKRGQSSGNPIRKK